VAYPSACTPQAWASGAVFLLLQASLGIDIDAEKGFVGVRGAYLPAWLDRISVKNLLIGGGRATVHFRRGTDGVEVGLSDVDGNIRLLM
jgi:glycogen debranching enzyme